MASVACDDTTLDLRIPCNTPIEKTHDRVSRSPTSLRRARRTHERTRDCNLRGNRPCINLILAHTRFVLCTPTERPSIVVPKLPKPKTLTS